jgi:hypothetical protein
MANQLGLNEEGLLFTCEDDLEEKFFIWKNPRRVGAESSRQEEEEAVRSI